jgi:hypothetical protein
MFRARGTEVLPSHAFGGHVFCPPKRAVLVAVIRDAILKSFEDQRVSAVISVLDSAGQNRKVSRAKQTLWTQHQTDSGSGF